MATVQLVAFNAASAVSADQQVGAGEVHTLIPVFDSGPGAVLRGPAKGRQHRPGVRLALRARPRRLRHRPGHLHHAVLRGGPIILLSSMDGAGGASVT